jgi:hypothetical protein
VSELFRVGADVISERNMSIVQEGLRAFFQFLILEDILGNVKMQDLFSVYVRGAELRQCVGSV